MQNCIQTKTGYLKLKFTKLKSCVAACAWCQDHSLTLPQGHLNFVVVNIFRNHWADQSQISFRYSLGCGAKFVQMIKMDAMLIYGKNLSKIFPLGTDRLMSLKLCIQHQALEYYQVRSNDDPRLTFDLFMQRSTLFPWCICMGKLLNGGYS